MFARLIESTRHQVTEPDCQRNRKSFTERSPSIQLRRFPSPKKLSNRQNRQSHHIFTRRLLHTPEPSGTTHEHEACEILEESAACLSVVRRGLSATRSRPTGSA